MIDRIIDISESRARLSVRLGNLAIERDGDPAATVPLDEVAVLVVSQPAVTYTHAVFTGLMGNGGAVVVCGERHLPTGLMLPLEGHHLHAERLERQVAASLPVRKRLWRQIVQTKIRAQGRLLSELRGHDAGLLALAARVRSGDAGNAESTAARRYWRALFEDESFRRGRHKGGPNLLLNYGYAILRALMGRAIVAAGLHPSIGIHHHNRYNPFRLADDLIEPFRPVVDRAVVRYAEANPIPEELDRTCKAAMLDALLARFNVEGDERALFDVAARTAVSLAQVFEGKREQILLPEW